MGAQYIPVSSNMKPSAAIRQIDNYLRQLSAEGATKTVSNASRTAYKTGKVGTNAYGSLFYDSSHTARVFVGLDPYDGEPVIAHSKAGFDILETLKSYPNDSNKYLFNSKLA